MGENSKYLLIFVFSLFSSSSALSNDMCITLANTTPSFLSNQLTSFSKNVLGKPADEWSETDFLNLKANIQNCALNTNSNKGNYKIIENNWVSFLNDSAKVILPISSHNTAIRYAYSELWNWGRVPSCLNIIKWKRDPIWLTDNSEEVFGKNLSTMNDTERTITSGFVNECKTVVYDVLNTVRLNARDGELIINDIALTVDREAEASKEIVDKIAPSLRLYHNGKRVPLAYLSPSSRRWVEFTNNFETTSRSMRVEDMVALSNWIDKVTKAGRSGPDLLYANAVRKVISNRMFND